MLFNRNGQTTVLENTDLAPEEESLIMEAALCEGLSNEELETFLENSMEVNDAIRMDIVQEKSIVRLDKKAKLQRSYMAAIFTIAKRKKDKKFKKLQTLWKMETAIEKYLIKRYGNEAMRQAKKSMQNAKKSNSQLVKKAVANVNKSLNGGKVVK